MKYLWIIIIVGETGALFYWAKLFWQSQRELNQDLERINKKHEVAMKQINDDANREQERILQAKIADNDRMITMLRLVVDRLKPTRSAPYAGNKRMIVVDGKPVDRASCIEEDGKIVAMLNSDGVIEDV